MYQFNKSSTSSATPYLVPTNADIGFVSIVTVGDPMPRPDGSTSPFVGIPDGIGAYDNGDGTITVLVNHELPAATGAVRAHGSAGAFVDRLIVDKTSLAIVGSEDLVKTVMIYNTTTDSFVDAKGTAANALGRLCSGDLADVSAFFDAETGLGTTDRIYLSGEEVGAEGRAFAFIATGDEAGIAYELPWLGKFSWENALASPDSGSKTVVIGTDDSTPGQVYLYVGQKQATGNAAEQAGLTDGQLYGIKVPGLTLETAALTIPGGQSAFTLAALGDVSEQSGASLEAESDANGVTEFFRPEDGAWDPTNPNAFYFVTTGNFNAPSRLYRMDFYDVKQPELGGTITLLLDGSEGQKMLDNMDVNDEGLVIMQEDPGNNARLAKVWEYNPFTDTLTELAQHDPARFTAPGALTQDEESSGVVDISDALGLTGEKAYLMDVQAHYGLPSPLVEGGQLLVMTDKSVTVAPTDGPGRLTVGNAEVSENGQLVFTVTRIEGDNGAATVDYALNFLAGGATAADFAPGTATSGKISFADGETSKTITLTLANDSIVEGDELVGITLSNAAGAGIADPVALATIEDDDGITSAGTNKGDNTTGGKGSDKLSGQNGNDVLNGAAGADRLDGGNGEDNLDGGDGDDTLIGGNGVDTLLGGAGDDFIIGGNGDDKLSGGVGADSFVVTKGGGSDRVSDFYAALDVVAVEQGISLAGSQVSDVNADGKTDLILSFSNGGGTLTLLGVNDVNDVQIVGWAA